MAQRRFARVRLEMIKEKTLYTDLRFLDTPQKAAEFARSLYAYCEANRPGLRSKTAAFCF